MYIIIGLAILAVFCILFGSMTLIAGHPGDEYILNNPNAFKIIVTSWITHIIVALIFYFASYLIFRKIWNLLD